MCLRKSAPLDLGQLGIALQNLLLEVVQVLCAFFRDDNLFLSMNILLLGIAVVRALQIVSRVFFTFFIFLVGVLFRLLGGPGDHLCLTCAQINQ